MTIELPPLPYQADALEPHISERTISFHYGRHHASYVSNLNRMIEGTPRAQASLEQIVRAAPSGSVAFNNAAQAWNHDFYWKSMSPSGGGSPSGMLATALKVRFGSVDAFLEEFRFTALSNFGSGWTWLAAGSGGATDALVVTNTDDADTPLRHGQVPLLTLDVWEHAYYLDYQNARAAYVDAFLEHLLNWEFASANWDRLLAA